MVKAYEAPAGESRVSAQVLVIEDELGIVDFLRRGLSAAGFEVQAELDGIEGERQALSGNFDVVVLDLMLPRRGGLEILSTLRKSKPSLPVIVLSARGEIEDRVVGLDSGAVDYLVKPFSIAELVARLRAHLRASGQTDGVLLRCGDIEVNLLTRKVTRDGQQVALSGTELDLLVHMMRHPGRVLTREQILSSVWGYEHDPHTNVVDVYIGYLRRKLSLKDNPVPIFTVRTVGYRLDDAG